jgi:hypothetical protein
MVLENAYLDGEVLTLCWRVSGLLVPSCWAGQALGAGRSLWMEMSHDRVLLVSMTCLAGLDSLDGSRR